NRSALLLAARKSNAALANESLILLGEAFNIHRNVRSLGGPSYHLITGILNAERNVFSNGFTEQKGFLGNEPNFMTETCQWIRTNRSLINQHASRRSVINSRNQIDQSCLAGTCGANNSQARTRGNA